MTYHIRAASVALSLAIAVQVASASAAPLSATGAQPKPPQQLVLIQAPAPKRCRREPIWGFRMSPFCKPTGICSDRVIKGYRTVCS